MTVHILLNGMYYLCELCIACAFVLIPWQLNNVGLTSPTALKQKIVTTKNAMVALFLVCGLTHLVGFLGILGDFNGLRIIVSVLTAACSISTIYNLKRSYNDLEDLVRSIRNLNTEILHHREMRVEMSAEIKKLEDDLTSRQNMLSAVSHELRTPLQSIIGMVEMFGSSFGNLNSSQKDIISTVLYSARLLCSLVNDILDSSKYQQGTFQIEQGSVSVVGTITAVMKMCSRKAVEKGIYLRYRILTDIPGEIQGDSTRMFQLISNLVSNAIKFTDSGGVIVEVSMLPSERKKSLMDKFHADPDTTIITDEKPNKRSTRHAEYAQLGHFNKAEIEVETTNLEKVSLLNPIAESIFNQATSSVITDVDMITNRNMDSFNIETNGWLLFTIADTGHGIPKRQHEQIFRPYEQSSEATARTHGGSGLGLWISSLLTDKMGGTMILKSKAGCGSRFSFLIPFQYPRCNSIVAKMPNPIDLPRNVLIDLPRNEHILKVPYSAQIQINDVRSESDVRFHVSNGIEDFNGINVMLVDDNKINRVVIQKMLNMIGFSDSQIVTIESGEKAHEYCMDNEKRIDVVLCDINMPGLDGFETTAKMKSLPFRQNLIVVAFTASNATHEYQSKLKREHFDGLLMKPCTTKSIQSLMQKVSLVIKGEKPKDVIWANSEEWTVK
mmetsp:Transcript_28634/g.35142  ORF Transcript_28634/g.35142 Transcript_28634/m.35142 type:complete len:668 (+) Transcript_28634:554-2557(+)